MTNSETISNITLEYLMNKEQYAKYINNKNPEKKAFNNKDKKFYKKRIYELTKQLLNNEKPEPLYADVKNAFDLYIKSCIENFKMIDKTDIIQEDYAGIYDIGEIDIKNEINIDGIQTLEDSDKLMMRSIKITEPNPLERMVKRTSTKVATPVIIPHQKDINLKDPVLKKKGIKKKLPVNSIDPHQSPDKK
jgi:hypothetical protein